MQHLRRKKSLKKPGRSRWRRLRRRTRPLRHVMLIATLEGARALARRLPHAWALGLGRALGRLAWSCGGVMRRRAEGQLLATGIAADPPAARRLSRRVFEGIGMNTIEWLHTIAWPAARFREQIRIENIEFAESLLTDGHGIIVVSAHQGNWELLLRGYEAWTGRPVAAVMAPQRDRILNDWLIRMRQFGDSRLIPSASAVIGMVRHLRRGGLLALLVDQDSNRGRGVFVDFFGRPAYTPAGPAHLALRTGAPLVPVTITRDPADPHRHVIRFDEPIWPDLQAGDKEAEVLRLTQAFTRVLERHIREYPDQWVWVHDRWHHRPGERIPVRGTRRLSTR